MSLDEEIREAKHDIVTDGYDMSIGELINLYKDKELTINPNFQRYFIWSEIQKTRFIESILLGIPVPSIFVYQNKDGVWELVDGLQRLSTLFQFAGILRDPDGSTYENFVLTGTNMLPSLEAKAWGEGMGEDSEPIGSEHQLEIKRSRMRVEILKKESDTQAKFELFQRLNTGGTHLEPQEVRNAVMLMINEDFHNWIHELSEYEHFKNCINISDNQEKRQYHVELVIRFFVYRNKEYFSGLDVHEYIDRGMLEIADSKEFDKKHEEDIFKNTFKILDKSLGSKTFKKWDGNKFKGKFLISAYEAISYGLSQNVDTVYDELDDSIEFFIEERVKEIWEDETYINNSGAGVRGSTRLSNLLPKAEEYFSIK